MSVTFHLYQIENNIEYLGSYLDKYSNDDLNTGNCEEWNTEEKLRSQGLENEANEYILELEKESFSDKCYHKLFELPGIRDFRCQKVNRAIRAMLKRVKLPVKNYSIKNRAYNIKYIIVNEVGYRQGWFLKPRFFKKTWTEVIFTDKNKMVKFMRYNFDFKGKQHERAIEAIEYFTNLWEEMEKQGKPLMFVCAW